MAVNVKMQVVNKRIIDMLREETGLTKDQCREAYISLFSKIIPTLLAEEGGVDLNGFGKFKIKNVKKKPPFWSPYLKKDPNYIVSANYLRFSPSPMFRTAVLKGMEDGDRK